MAVYLFMSVPVVKPTKGNILVIDDNPIIQRTLYFALRDQGYAVQMVGEISEALKVVRQQKFDVLLLDINFPLDPAIGPAGTRDGFWALEWFQRLEETAGTPIIIISGNAADKSSEQALAGGAAAYFQKPIDKSALASKIESIIRPAASEGRK